MYKPFLPHKNLIDTSDVQGFKVTLWTDQSYNYVYRFSAMPGESKAFETQGYRVFDSKSAYEFPGNAKKAAIQHIKRLLK